MILYIKNKKYLSKPLHIFLTGGTRIGKTFTLMCIIQNMLRYYIKDISNVDPFKPKVMKLTYIRKITFNINGMTIHSTLAIPLNENFNELKTLSDEKVMV
jgi:hypothetical protein